MLPVPASARPRVAVLGVGTMGRHHARVFAQLGNEFDLVGVYDPRSEAALEVARAFRVKAFSEESDAIEAADLVVIASPIEAHAGAARRALARGRHLFVEKPLCATAAQAFALALACGVERGQRLFVGHSERFNPVVRALRSALRPGDVHALRLRRTTPLLRSPHEHSALLSLGVHDLDLIAYLTASPVALREVPYVDDDRADLVLTAAAATVAWMHVDRKAEVRERSLEVETPDALFLGDLLAKTLTVRWRGDAAITRCELAPEEPLVAQALAIARALQGTDGEAASGVDGAQALALVEQAMHSVPAKRPHAAEASP